MSEVIKNKYLDFGGLSKYDERIKSFIASADETLRVDLAAAIAALDAKIGSLEIEGSDDKTLAEIVESIQSSIVEILDAQDALVAQDVKLAEKDAELAVKIKEISDNLEFITGSSSDNEATLGEINSELQEVKNKIVALEAIDHDAYKGADEQVLADAKEYADDLVKDAEGNDKFDAAGAAATAQAAAIEAAAGDATTKANAAQAAAEAYVDDLVKDADGNVKFDAAGSADAALENANKYADDLVKDAEGNDKFDAAGSAAAAQAAAEATAKAYVDAISHASDVKYDGKYINLYDANGEKIGDGFDASPFVVDGMLDSVDFVKDADGNATSTLRFTFNVETDGSDSDGNKKTIDVDFAKYVDVYHADDTSIELNSETKTFSVKEVAANKTKLGQRITIAGGPLANNIAESGESWPTKWTNGNEKFIPEDATMYDIVMNLFCVEKWPVKSNNTSNVSTSDATLVSTINAPSVSYNGKTTHNSSSTVEVGSTVEYTISNGSSSYTATPHKASGFTYGYSASDDNTKDSSNSSVSATFNDADGKTTVAVVADSVPTLTITGKVNETINGTAGSAAAASASKSGSVVIAAGDNKISAKCKSVTYTGTCSELPVYYGCSNLGNTDTKGDGTGTKYPSTQKASITKTSTAVESSTVTVNCVGAYKYFYGYPDAIPADKDQIVALANKGFLSGSELSVTTAGTVPVGKYMIVAVPKGWEYTSFVNGMNLDDVSAFYTDTKEVDYTLDNGDVVKYSVHWCGPFGADTNYNSFKITKK